MWAFILRNILQRLLLLVFVSILAHSVAHLAPGQPSEVDPSNPRMKPEDIARIRAAFHLDEPLHLQYVYWMRDLATGELKSFKDSQPVLPKIWQRFLNSLPLFICETLIIWSLSLSHHLATGTPWKPGHGCAAIWRRGLHAGPVACWATLPDSMASSHWGKDGKGVSEMVVRHTGHGARCTVRSPVYPIPVTGA